MADRINVLWVSKTAPYDNVPHAGGKVHNYYLKALHADPRFDVRLVTFVDSLFYREANDDLSGYGIEHEIIEHKTEGLAHALWAGLNMETRLNPWNRYGGLTYNFEAFKALSAIRAIAGSGYAPDIVILQWTQMGLLVDKVRAIFPGARFVLIEEDVAYQGAERAADISGSSFLRGRAATLKKAELAALGDADLVILNNRKDLALVRGEGVKTDFWVWCPYYQSLLGSERAYDGRREIVFYGAMRRRENWSAALWFLDEVFPSLEGDGYRFTVVGANPPEQLTSRVREGVTFTGFVDSVEPYFARALCLVAPLSMGAGIKVKVLEAMSAGLPVLTNDIGIEGIPAENGVSYLHCEAPSEYSSSITALANNPGLRDRVSCAARGLMRGSFSFEADAKAFPNRVFALAVGI